jgi:hypothetical protein
MQDPEPGRARRLEPAETDAGDGLTDADYASSFAVDVDGADARSPEQWARGTLEGAPRILRWFVLIGWKAVLRLRLEPRSAGTILGWGIRSRTADTVTLEVGSSLVTGRKVLKVEPDRLVLTTFVRFERTQGRVLWSVIAPIHHLIEPLLLTLAAKRSRQERTNRQP